MSILDLFDGRGATTSEAATRATGSSAEAETECDDGTEDDPIRVTKLGSGACRAVVADTRTNCTPEDHVDDPYDKGDESSKSSREGHEDGTETRVTRAAEAK